MTLWEAAILGIVEGITEFLPISSTGHLILAAFLLELNGSDETKQAIDAFLIAIQGGAILAVLGLYRKRVAQMIAGLLGRDQAGRKLALQLLVAFLPAAITGPFLNDVIESFLFRPAPVIAALALGGAAMIAIGKWEPKGSTDIGGLSWRGALAIGLFQCLAMWPGMSRSMVTIVGGVLVGLHRRHAAEFSFLLGLPTLGGACVYRIAKAEMAGQSSPFEIFGWAPVIVGIVVATISAAIAIKWLVAWLNHHGLSVFGWYRMVLAALYGVLGPLK